ncbi:hypothetical protein GWI72_08430 [Microvirga tunisiensis]|uniref:Uncharacterized protein n=2 Tax=Pannonibacter tanglangensis TaxID=2750084 RepID=A0ABW9ZCR8_9HYPH|nr:MULTISPECIES: hypothetical protein [unclassified Pannonibacter]NBN62635.1 hypothetical protein [Pannonibacter sp. XCT-34]NBN78290.1 hypothetical protein [Pannonibacter sp. XCT-53]
MTDLPFLRALADRFLPQDPLFRLLTINGVLGCAIAMLVFAGLLLTNTAGLYDLIATADEPVVPLVLLAFGLVITLGSAVMGSAIMLVSGDDEDGSGRRDRADAALVPIRVEARTARRQVLPRD